MKTKKEKKTKAKFVTDTIDVLQFGENGLGGSFYSPSTRNKYMQPRYNSASINGVKQMT